METLTVRILANRRQDLADRPFDAGLIDHAFIRDIRTAHGTPLFRSGRRLTWGF
jgi:hypothetical protein